MNGQLSKEYDLISPVSGEVIELSQVPDEVFADTLRSNGVAVDFEGDTIVSPGDGELSLVFKTQNAFGVTLENGVEVLVYVGANTAELSGEGFKLLAEEGETVRKGQPIIKVDRNTISSKGYPLVVPVIVSNFKVDDMQFAYGENVEAGKDKILTYTMI